MAVQPTARGFIVILEGSAVPSLRRIAKRRSMVILEAEAADQVLRVIRRERPRVVIVQVGRILNETLKLIRSVTTAGRRVPVIAVATKHASRIEREVLRAGASYYLPGTKQSLVERLLDAMLQPKDHS